MNISGLDKLTFEMNDDQSYQGLSEALEYWAEQFYQEAISDPYKNQIAYLMFNMSQEMRKVTD